MLPNKALQCAGLGAAGLAAAAAGFAGAPSGPSEAEGAQPPSAVHAPPASRWIHAQPGVNAWALPEFQLRDLDGRLHSLGDWRGQVILLNFWASWCAPCISEITDLVGYQRRYGPRGLQVLGLGIDEERKLRNVKRTLDINYPVLVVDPFESSQLMTQWGNKRQMVPYTVVIGRAGRVRYIHRGKVDEAVFEEFVLPLLATEQM